MTNQILFYKDGNHLSLTFYAGGLTTIIDNTGHAVKISQEEIYDLLRGYFDGNVGK